MKVLLTRLTAFVGRHWLRVGLIAGALILLSQKQVNFNVRLGYPGESVPTVAPVPLGPTEPVAETEPLLLSDGGGASAGGFFSRFNFFGGAEEASRVERLTRHRAEIAGFLERFGHVAQAEQEKFGIPASVILGVGLLYSEAGTARSAIQANSYFGLRCGGDWAGASTNGPGGKCLRSYATAWTGFRDFSLTVTGDRFARMQQFDARDYRRWARGLRELGLNGDESLASDLVSVIEGYELFRYD